MSNARRLFHLRALPRAAFALAACAVGSSAMAQTGNATNGQALYQQRVNFPVSGALNCEDCHGPAYLFRAAASAGAISGAISANRGGMSLYAFLTTQQINDIAAYVATALPPPPPPAAPPPASSPPPATPTASPDPALFPGTAVGSASPVVNVLFTNTAPANVTFNTPAIVAAAGDTQDFLVAAPTSGTPQCISGRVMAPGTSCSFGVQFAPRAAGTRSATWTVNFMGTVSPRTVTMQGLATTASAPAPVPAPAASSAIAPSAGGGGAVEWTALLALAALSGLASVRRRPRSSSTFSVRFAHTRRLARPGPDCFVPQPRTELPDFRAGGSGRRDDEPVRAIDGQDEPRRRQRSNNSSIAQEIVEPRCRRGSPGKR